MATFFTVPTTSVSSSASAKVEVQEQYSCTLEEAQAFAEAHVQQMPHGQMFVFSGESSIDGSTTTMYLNSITYLENDLVKIALGFNNPLLALVLPGYEEQAKKVMNSTVQLKVTVPKSMLVLEDELDVRVYSTDGNTGNVTRKDSKEGRVARIKVLIDMAATQDYGNFPNPQVGINKGAKLSIVAAMVTSTTIKITNDSDSGSFNTNLVGTSEQFQNMLKDMV